jgi:23S rRNA pseudouridine2457 synthase
MPAQYRYYIFYKPFGYLSQFTDEGNHPGLGSLNIFPPNIYPVGRLDHDSEGLLLLTDNPAVNKLLLHPANKHQRTYWSQVEGEIDQEAIQRLQEGVVIRINKKDYKTLPAIAKSLNPEPEVPERNPPIRYRASIPTSWLALSLIEGKNRQVRRMTAAVGFPTLRLIRYSIEGIELGTLKVGEAREISEQEFLQKLRLNPTRPAQNSARKNRPEHRHAGKPRRNKAQ